MSNKDFERVIREHTRIALHKANLMKEAKSSWKDILDAGIDMYSDYAKEQGAKADRVNANSQASSKIPKDAPLSQDQATRIDKAIEKNTGQTLPKRDYSSLPKTQADVPKELPKIDVAGEKSKDKPAEPKTPAAGTGKTAMTFKQAFAAARKEAKGGKGQFEYKGTKYQTNIQGTGTKEKPQEKFISAGKQKVTSVKVGSDAPKAPEAPKTPEAPKAPEAAKPAPETPKTTSQTTPQTTSPTTSDTKSEPAVDTKVQYAPSGTEGPSSSGGTGGAGGEGGSGSNAGKGGDGGAGSEGGKGGKGGKGGNTLGECVVIAGNKYRIV